MVVSAMIFGKEIGILYDCYSNRRDDVYRSTFWREMRDGCKPLHAFAVADIVVACSIVVACTAVVACNNTAAAYIAVVAGSCLGPP